MNPPSIQRFFAEDYKDAPAWFKQKFIATLNLFTFPVYSALNGNLDEKNLAIQYYSFNLIGNATATSNKVSFQTTLNGPVHGVTLMQAQVTGAAVPTYLSAAPAIASWTVIGKALTIQSITGLSTGVTYSLTVKVE